jgi:flagellin-like hook-associated protein FlgL
MLFLNRILNNNQAEISKNYERLSSGYIRLQDDPANFAIYEKMEAQIREMDKRVNNNKDMISYYTCMDATLSALTESLQRVRELLVQKSDIIYADSDRAVIDNEIRHCYQEIMYELKEAEFNKVKLFTDLLSNKEFINYFDDKKYYDFKNVDNLLNFIITERGTVGAYSSRLESQIKGQAVYRENATRFKSQGDIDYSGEISNLRRNNVLILANILLLKK